MTSRSLFLCFHAFTSMLFLSKNENNYKAKTTWDQIVTLTFKPSKDYMKGERCHLSKMSKQKSCTFMRHYTLNIMSRDENDFHTRIKSFLCVFLSPNRRIYCLDVKANF